MNKMEIINDILKRLFEIQTVSKKVAYFNYYGGIDCFEFHIAKSKKDFLEKVLSNRSVYFSGVLKTNLEDFEKIYSEIESIKHVPDDLEEILTFKIPESRARELGLLT